MDQLHLDTRELPVAERLDRWRAGITDYQVEAVEPDRPFDGRSVVTALGALLISESVLPPLRFRRTPAMIRADGRTHWTLSLMLEGSFQGHADGRPLDSPPGIPCLLDLARPSELVTTQGRSIIMVLPRNLLQGGWIRTGAHGALADSAATRLLAECMTAMCRFLPDLAPAAALPTARALCELVSASLPPPEDGLANRAQRGQALRARLVTLVEARIGERFDTNALCAELAVSRSALYRAVEGAGGVAGLIRTCRLEAAHRALTDSADGRSIQEVAIAVGYHNRSQFSRQFHAAFGYTAADLRRRPAVPSPFPPAPDAAVAFREAVDRLASGPSPT